MYFFETLDLSSPNGPLKKGLYLYRRQFFSLHGIAQRHCETKMLMRGYNQCCVKIELFVFKREQHIVSFLAPLGCGFCFLLMYNISFSIS